MKQQRLACEFTRRNLLQLVAACIFLGVLPMLCAAAPLAEEKPLPKNKNSLSGRIFIDASLLTQTKDADEPTLIGGIIAIDPETGRWEKILLGDYDHYYTEPRASHDGKTLVVKKRNRDLQTHRDKSFDICMCDLATNRVKRLLADENAFCIFSPDDKRLVVIAGYFAEDNSSKDITWQVPLDGSTRKRLPIAETDEIGDWSSDGRWFVAVTNRTKPFGRNYQLYRMRPDGTEERRLTKDGLNVCPRFSPDSKRIVYLHQTDALVNSLHVMDVDGKNDVVVRRDRNKLESVEYGCFSSDGRRLAVVLHDSNPEKHGDTASTAPHCQLEIMDVDGANRRELPLVDAKSVGFGRPDWR